MVDFPRARYVSLDVQLDSSSLVVVDLNSPTALALFLGLSAAVIVPYMHLLTTAAERMVVGWRDSDTLLDRDLGMALVGLSSPFLYLGLVIGGSLAS